MECDKSIIDVFQGLLTPAIALVALWIAFQQRRISADQKEIAFQQKELNRIKLNAELYERRSKVLGIVGEFIRHAVAHAALSEEQVVKFYRETREAVYLYGDDIDAYVEELFEQGLKLVRAVEGYKDAIVIGSDADPAPHIKAKHQAMAWFGKQSQKSKELFKPFLQLK